MILRRFLYRNFRGAFSLKQWLRRRVTKGGLLVLVGLAATAVLGLDTNQTVAYQLFTFLCCLLLVSACAIEARESLLDLMFIGPEAHCFTAGRGLGQAEKMLEILACVHVCRDKPFETLHQLVMQRHAALSGCICILLAWDEARQHFVNQLRARGVPTLPLLIAPAAAHTAPAPGPAAAQPWGVHQLEMGRIAEGLARL